MRLLDFYMPKYKNEYVEWLSEKYPQDRIAFLRMDIAHLKAIYILVRKKEA